MQLEADKAVQHFVLGILVDSHLDIVEDVRGLGWDWNLKVAQRNEIVQRGRTDSMVCAYDAVADRKTYFPHSQSNLESLCGVIAVIFERGGILVTLSRTVAHSLRIRRWPRGSPSLLSARIITEMQSINRQLDISGGGWRGSHVKIDACLDSLINR